MRVCRGGVGGRGVVRPSSEAAKEDELKQRKRDAQLAVRLLHSMSLQTIFDKRIMLYFAPSLLLRSRNGMQHACCSNILFDGSAVCALRLEGRRCNSVQVWRARAIHKRAKVQPAHTVALHRPASRPTYVQAAKSRSLCAAQGH